MSFIDGVVFGLNKKFFFGFDGLDMLCLIVGLGAVYVFFWLRMKGGINNYGKH